MTEVWGHATYTNQMIKTITRGTPSQEILFSPHIHYLQIIFFFIPTFKIFSSHCTLTWLVLGLTLYLHLCLKGSRGEAGEITTSHIAWLFKILSFMSSYWEYAITSTPVSGSFWSFPDLYTVHIIRLESEISASSQDFLSLLNTYESLVNYNY